MKKLLTLIPVLIAGSLLAQTPVRFDTKYFTGGRLNRRITVTPAVAWWQSGTNLVGGRPLEIVPASGSVTVYLLPSDYWITVDGSNARLKMSVYESTNVLNAVTLITNLPTYYYTNPPAAAVSGFAGTVSNLFSYAVTNLAGSVSPLWDDLNPGTTNTFNFSGFTVAYTGEQTEANDELAGFYFYTNAFAPSYFIGSVRPAFIRANSGAQTNSFILDDGWTGMRVGSTTFFGAESTIPSALAAYTGDGAGTFYITNYTGLAATNTLTSYNVMTFTNGLCVTNILQ